MVPASLPNFSDGDPEFWISNMEEFMFNSDMLFDQYVKFALPFLKGDAKIWAESRLPQILETEWCDFVYNLIWKFDPSRYTPKEREVEDEPASSIKDNCYSTETLHTSDSAAEEVLVSRVAAESPNSLAVIESSHHSALSPIEVSVVAASCTHSDDYFQNLVILNYQFLNIGNMVNILENMNVKFRASGEAENHRSSVDENQSIVYFLWEPGPVGVYCRTFGQRLTLNDCTTSVFVKMVHEKEVSGDKHDHILLIAMPNRIHPSFQWDPGPVFSDDQQIMAVGYYVELVDMCANAVEEKCAGHSNFRARHCTDHVIDLRDGCYPAYGIQRVNVMDTDSAASQWHVYFLWEPGPYLSIEELFVVYSVVESQLGNIFVDVCLCARCGPSVTLPRYFARTFVSGVTATQHVGYKQEQQFQINASIDFLFYVRLLVDVQGAAKVLNDTIISLLCDDRLKSSGEYTWFGCDEGMRGLVRNVGPHQKCGVLFFSMAVRKDITARFQIFWAGSALNSDVLIAQCTEFKADIEMVALPTQLVKGFPSRSKDQSIYSQISLYRTASSCYYTILSNRRQYLIVQLVLTDSSLHPDATEASLFTLLQCSTLPGAYITVMVCSPNNFHSMTTWLSYTWRSSTLGLQGLLVEDNDIRHCIWVLLTSVDALVLASPSLGCFYWNHVVLGDFSDCAQCQFIGFSGRPEPMLNLLLQFWVNSQYCSDWGYHRFDLGFNLSAFAHLSIAPGLNSSACRKELQAHGTKFNYNLIVDAPIFVEAFHTTCADNVLRAISGSTSVANIYACQVLSQMDELRDLSKIQYELFLWNKGARESSFCALYCKFSDNVKKRMKQEDITSTDFKSYMFTIIIIPVKSRVSSLKIPRRNIGSSAALLVILSNMGISPWGFWLFDPGIVRLTCFCESMEHLVWVIFQLVISFGYAWNHCTWLSTRVKKGIPRSIPHLLGFTVHDDISFILYPALTLYRRQLLAAELHLISVGKGQFMHVLLVFYGKMHVCQGKFVLLFWLNAKLSLVYALDSYSICYGFFLPSQCEMHIVGSKVSALLPVMQSTEICVMVCSELFSDHESLLKFL